jgi:hypothetical protein
MFFAHFIPQGSLRFNLIRLSVPPWHINYLMNLFSVAQPLVNKPGRRFRMTEMKTLTLYAMRIRATDFMSASHQRNKIGYRVPHRVFKVSFLGAKRFADLTKLNSAVL